MSGQNLYYDWVSILRNAGCQVQVGSQNSGWERRARSSGGFPARPLGVWWHHTASQTAIANDLTWQCHSCPDKPVGNMTLDRNGCFWPVAGGASNCAGKGGPWTFSRGTVALDSGNTNGIQIEVANNGVGEPWPQAQVDAYFLGSNALNAAVGNRPDDVVTHRRWAPSRKIDPATASAVQGPWRPSSETSSGTWNLDDIKAECIRRAGAAPGPGPQPPQKEDDMIPTTVWINNDRTDQFVVGASDKALYHRIFTFKDGWSEWENLGGMYLGSVSVAVREEDNRIDVYGQGADGQVWQNTFDWASGWSGAQLVGGWPG